MRLLTADETRTIDQHAIQHLGIPGVVLMENAGKAATDVFCRELADLFPGPVLILAGKGNNGGDGYVMARRLAEQGWQIETLVLASGPDITGEAAIMLDILDRMQQSPIYINEINELHRNLRTLQPAVVIDAMIGTGLRSEVSGLYAEAIDVINNEDVLVFSVDIPSGVDASSGRICGSAVRADLTVTFDHAKIGHASNPGAAYAGLFEVMEIGLPKRPRPQIASAVCLIDAETAVQWLPSRAAHGHKGTFGHLLLVAGSTGKTGAAALAADAAIRGGCGLVTVATPASVHGILEIKLTEAMTYPLHETDGLIGERAKKQIVELLSTRQAVAIGPGLGQSDELAKLIPWFLTSCDLPMVIDADGLNLLAGQLHSLKQVLGPSPVLTPHPGEMARLCGLTVQQIEENRYQIACEFAREHGVVLLLKGARTVIAAPNGQVAINSSGNDGLATGGSGDVLSGLIASLLTQGLEPFAAACLGAWLQGRASELTADTQGIAGMAASDLLLRLPAARHELTELQTKRTNR